MYVGTIIKGVGDQKSLSLSDWEQEMSENLKLLKGTPIYLQNLSQALTQLRVFIIKLNYLNMANYCVNYRR